MLHGNNATYAYACTDVDHMSMFVNDRTSTRPAQYQDRTPETVQSPLPPKERECHCFGPSPVSRGFSHINILPPTVPNGSMRTQPWGISKSRQQIPPWSHHAFGKECSSQQALGTQ